MYSKSRSAWKRSSKWCGNWPTIQRGGCKRPHNPVNSRNLQSASLFSVRQGPETLGQVEQHVQRRLNGQVREFRLSLRNGGLVLEGRTKTYHAKQLTQHAVMEAVDLPICANEIEVA